MAPDSATYRAYAYDRQQRIERSDFVCQMPFSFPSLMADGTVIAYEQDCRGTHPLGQFGNGASFRDIWFGDQAAEVRRKIRDRRHVIDRRTAEFFYWGYDYYGAFETGFREATSELASLMEADPACWRVALEANGGGG